MAELRPDPSTTNEFASYNESSDSFEAYQNDKPDEVPTEPSDKNFNAQIAVLDEGNSVLNSYQDLEASEPGDRKFKSDKVLEDVRANERNELANVISNDVAVGTMSSDEAAGIFNSAVSEGVDRKNSLEHLGTKMAILPANETAEDAERRALFPTISEDITKRFQDIQAAVNGEILATDKSMAGAVGDFLQLMIPFDESLFTAQVIDKVRGGDLSAASEAFFLLGNSKKDLREYYQNELTFDEQTVFLDSLKQILQDSSGIIFTNDNDLAQKDLFLTIADGSYYGDFDQAIDNVISVLDLVGLGGLLRPVKRTKAATRAARRYIRSKKQPASVGKVTAETNPEQAEALHTLAVTDESGEAAQAIYGTTRSEAVLDSELPQVRGEDEVAENIPYGLNEAVDRQTKSGRQELSEAEILSAQIAAETKLYEGLKTVGNLVVDRAKSLAPIRREDGTLKLDTTFSNGGRPWTSARAALESATLGTRRYNVEESQITLLQKQGDEYVPTTLAEVEAKEEIRSKLVKAKKKLPEEFKKANMQDDYLVRVEFDRELDLDAVAFDRLQVKKNFFDRVPYFNKLKQGGSSLTRHLVDAASMFDPRISLGAARAVDRGSAIETSLLELGDKFVKGFSDLKEDRKEVLMSIIQEENYKEKFLDLATLKAQGLSNSEIDTLKSWRETWDSVYWLENRDLVNNLKAFGYMRYEDRSNGTELIAKPVGKGFQNQLDKAYNPKTNEYEYGISSERMDELYGKGGTIAKLRSPEMIGNRKVEYIIVENDINSPFLRELKDTDQILAYKQGYYTVRYKDPHIIEELELDETGRIIGRSAVATARDNKSAEAFVNSKNRALGEGSTTKFQYRTNRDAASDQVGDYWDIQRNSGRINQRVRGERLVGTKLTSNGTVEDTLGSLQSPVESLITSVRSISHKTSMTEYLNTLRARIIDEFGKHLPLDDVGNPMLPNASKPVDWSSFGGEHSKRAADLRSYLEYHNYLSYGYKNSLDDGWKAVLNMMADTVGGVSSTGERVLRGVADEVTSPTGWARARAFEAYLALNPLRQIIVQSHQATYLAANFPKYVLSQKLAREVTAIHTVMIAGDKIKNIKGFEKLVGMSYDDAIKLADEYKKTGFDAAIDRNNLVEDGVDQLISTGRFRSAKELHKKVVGTSRKIGFDAGERINIMSSWLAHRNRALEEGKDITSLRVKEEIMAKARNYTFNMNAAGDMPYNKNSLSLIFQFMQVPHKAMMQMFNRTLSVKERRNLALYNLAIAPLPIGFVAAIVGEENLPEDPDMRDLVINGLEGYTFNRMAQLAFDDDTRVDFTSLASMDPGAPLDVVWGLFNSDLTEVMTGAPSLSLFMGNNPRFTNIAREVGTLISEPSTENLQVAVETFAKYSSGFANFSQAYKERYVQEYMKRYSSSGAVVDPELTPVEAAAKIFGMDTVTAAMNRHASSELYDASKAAREDVKEAYRLQKQYLARRGVTVDNHRFAAEALGAFWVAATPGQQKHWVKLLKYDIENGDATVMNHVLRGTDYIPADEIRGIVNATGNKVLIDYMESVDKQNRFGEE